jgi:uncharacterized membrane protein YqjE
MEESTASPSELNAGTRRLARRLLAIGGNRLELLMVEVHEERRRLLQAFLTFVAMGTFGLLAGVAVTLAIGVLTWNQSPALAFAALALVYLTMAAFFYRRLVALQNQWKILPATLDQLQKDCSCLEEIIR